MSLSSEETRLRDPTTPKSVKWNIRIRRSARWLCVTFLLVIGVLVLVAVAFVAYFGVPTVMLLILEPA